MSEYPSLDAICKKWTAWKRERVKGQRGMEVFSTEPKIVKAEKLLNTKYDPVEELPGQPWVGATIIYENGLDVAQEFTYTAVQEIASTTSATMEKSIELGTEVEVGIDFPGLANTKTRFTFKGGRKRSSTEQQTQRDSAGMAPKFNVPPLTKAMATLTATKSKKQVKWRAYVAIGGSLLFTRKEGGSSQQNWTNLSGVISEAREFNLMRTPGWSIDSMKISNQRDFWGALWPYDDIEQIIHGGFPDDQDLPVVLGEISGTLTYESFANIHVAVKRMGPAEPNEVGIAGYIDSSYGLSLDGSGSESLEILNLGDYEDWVAAAPAVG